MNKSKIRSKWSWRMIHCRENGTSLTNLLLQAALTKTEGTCRCLWVVLSRSTQCISMGGTASLHSAACISQWGYNGVANMLNANLTVEPLRKMHPCTAARHRGRADIRIPSIQGGGGVAVMQGLLVHTAVGCIIQLWVLVLLAVYSGAVQCRAPLNPAVY